MDFLEKNAKEVREKQGNWEWEMTFGRQKYRAGGQWNKKGLL